MLGKLSVPGRPTIWINVGQGPIALAVGAGGGCLDIFTLLYLFSSLSPSLWETARYRLKYCLKGPLNPKQRTNQNKSFRYAMNCAHQTQHVYQIKSTLVISKSKGPAETLQDIRTSTYQMYRIEENTKRTTKFHKLACNLTPLVRNIC